MGSYGIFFSHLSTFRNWWSNTQAQGCLYRGGRRDPPSHRISCARKDSKTMANKWIFPKISGGFSPKSSICNGGCPWCSPSILEAHLFLETPQSVNHWVENDELMFYIVSRIEKKCNGNNIHLKGLGGTKHLETSDLLTPGTRPSKERSADW